MSGEFILVLGIGGLIPIYFLGCKLFDYINRKEYDMPLPPEGKMFFLLLILIVAYVILCVYEKVYL